MLKEEARGRELGQTLLHRLERAEIERFAQAAETFLTQAREEARQRTFHCTNCGAQLQLPAQVLSALHLACEYCRAINTFEPGTRARLVEHFCAHHLSQRAALPQWEALQAAQRLRRSTRGESAEVQRQVEAATRAWWQAYFTARAELVPMTRSQIELEVRARLRGGW